MEILTTISYVMQCDTTQRSKVSARFRRFVWQRIGFCSIALRPWEFYKIGNLFVVMEFSATTNFADHPATAKLSFVVIVVATAFFTRNGCKMRKFRGYLRRVVQKLPAPLCSLLLLPLTKPHASTAIFYYAAFASRFHEHGMKKSIKVTLNSFN